MKKVLICILVCLMAALTLTSCKGKKTEATKAVEAMISELGEITIDSADELAAIDKAYAALSADEKDRVKNYDKFTKAKQDLKALKTKFKSYDEMNETIRQIIDLASTTFSRDDTDFTDLISKGNAILEQYKQLSKEEKQYVNVTDELEEALKKLSDMVGSTEKSAAEYVKAFNSIYAEENYEVAAVYCIKQLRDETQYHIFALTYKDADGKEHNLYANARCATGTTAEVIEQNKDVFFSETAADYSFNAVFNGNVDLDLETVLKLAK